MLRRKSETGIVKVRKGRQTYGIPVDQDGFVPAWALVARYQEVGDRRDRLSSTKLRHPPKVRPDQIIDWWIDPSSTDIEGIDTRDSPVYSVPLGIRGRKRSALSYVGIIAEKGEADRIKKVLAESFTAEELEAMTAGSSFYIKVVPHLRDCTGFYLRRQEGVPVPNVTLEQGTTPDGIVHEIVHHLKAIEGRSAFPTDAKGGLDSSFFRKSKDERNKLVTKEERETVLETVARTRMDPNRSGYYDDIPRRNGDDAYRHDQLLVSGGKIVKGKQAKRNCQKYYYETDICDALIANNARRRK